MDEREQINLCIDEMTKLQEKMAALEKQKKLNEKNEMLKKTTMEPNLKVLEDWLVDIEVVRSSNTGKPTGHYYNNPTEVMKAHIEATYNMFNIINKRLDDIEKKLAIYK